MGWRSISVLGLTLCACSGASSGPAPTEAAAPATAPAVAPVEAPGAAPSPTPSVPAAPVDPAAVAAAVVPAAPGDGIALGNEDTLVALAWRWAALPDATRAVARIVPSGAERGRLAVPPGTAPDVIAGVRGGTSPVAWPVPPASALELVVVRTTAPLNVRPGPTTEGDRIMPMPHETLAIAIRGDIGGLTSVAGESGAWSYVAYTARNGGWASSRYLDPVASPVCVPSLDAIEHWTPEPELEEMEPVDARAVAALVMRGVVTVRREGRADRLARYTLANCSPTLTGCDSEVFLFELSGSCHVGDMVNHWYLIEGLLEDVKDTTTAREGGDGILVTTLSVPDRFRVVAFRPGSRAPVLEISHEGDEAPDLLTPHREGDSWWPLGLRIAHEGVQNYAWNGQALVVE